MAAIAVLEGRGVLRVSGADRVQFLQGLISNDVTKLGPDRSLYASLLTAQGRFLHDFFLTAQDDAILIEGEGARIADLARRLSMFRLRAKVAIDDASAAHAVVVGWPGEAAESFGLAEAAGTARPVDGGVVTVDPRLAALGIRALTGRDQVAALIAASGLAPAPIAAYHRHRIGLGVPDGSRDLEIEKSILLENNFDELHGVSWDKGCYIGQELTARTKYRGLIKKRLVTVAIDGPTPAVGTPVLAAGTDAGAMRGAEGDLGLALLRLDAAVAAATVPLVCGDATLTPQPAPWMRFD